MFDMRRREFITLLGGAAAAWPLAARAQQPGKLPTIGFLVTGTPSSHGQWFAALVQRLHELGWIEGRTVAIEYRWAEGRTERFNEIAAEFVEGHGTHSKNSPQSSLDGLPEFTRGGQGAVKQNPRRGLPSAPGISSLGVSRRTRVRWAWGYLASR